MLCLRRMAFHVDLDTKISYRRVETLNANLIVSVAQHLNV